MNCDREKSYKYDINLCKLYKSWYKSYKFLIFDFSLTNFKQYFILIFSYTTFSIYIILFVLWDRKSDIRKIKMKYDIKLKTKVK